MARFKNKNSGFTFIETLVVIAIFLTLVLLVKTVFISNWFAYEENIVRDNLWQETNMFMEKISTDARKAHLINVTNDNGTTYADLFDLDDQPIATYTITNAGGLQMTDTNGNTTTFSNNIDVSNSSFIKKGRSIHIVLALTETLFTRSITFNTATEIYPRN